MPRSHYEMVVNAGKKTTEGNGLWDTTAPDFGGPAIDQQRLPDWITRDRIFAEGGMGLGPQRNTVISLNSGVVGLSF
jgi:hypothetical protein